MSILRVEQLEPRQLLSGSCFAPQSSPRPDPDAGSPSPRVAEWRPFVDFAPIHFSFDTPRESRAVVVEHFDPQPVQVVWLPIINEGAPRSGPASAGGGGIDDSGGVRQALVATRVSAGTETPRETTSAALPTAAPPARTSVQAAVLLDVVGAAAIRVTLPALVAVAPSVPAMPGRDEVLIPQNPVSSLPSIRETAPSGSEADQPLPATKPEQPATLPGVLSLLPPLDLVSLERGLRQFVAQIESAGQSLLRPVARGNMWPWVVAAAAALAACEIARREFRGQEFRGPSIDFSDF
jgi:hypothetical protein